MALFPVREADLVVLSQSVINGLATQAAEFPKSPYSAPELQADLDKFTAARDTLAHLQAQAAEAATAKRDILEALTGKLKAELRYLESATASDDQLGHFGWSGRRAPVPLQVPGQCRTLEVPRQGIGWVFLQWKDPTEGGKTAFYIVEERELPDGQWKHAATIVDTETTINSTAPGKALEYRVHAANKAGNGLYSNVVEVRG